MLHFFPAQRMKVRTTCLVRGQFMAYEAGNDDLDRAVGWGETQLEAIADLYACLRERGELED